MLIKNGINSMSIILSALCIMMLRPTLVYADSWGRGLAQLAIAYLVITSIQIVLIVLWFVIHLRQTKSPVNGQIFISAIDLAVIIFSSFTLSLLSRLGHGFWMPIIEKSAWLQMYKIMPVLLFMCILIFLSNKMVMRYSRLIGVMFHFLVCISIAVGFLVIFTPKIAGPVTKWFVDQEVLFRKAGDPFYMYRGYGQPERWSEYYGFDKELIDYYHFEEKLYKAYANHKPYVVDQEMQQRIEKNAPEYLVLKDIGDYKLEKQSLGLFRKKRGGTQDFIAKVYAGAITNLHYSFDHMDVTYYVDYRGEKAVRHLEVQVTKHEGGDSDRWLQHELMDYIGRGIFERQGNKILFTQKATYRGDSVSPDKKTTNFKEWFDVKCGWLHDNIVVIMTYSTPKDINAAPEDVIKEYLAKYPSTLKIADSQLNNNYQGNSDDLDREAMLYEIWLSRKLISRASESEHSVINDNDLIVSIKHIFLFLNLREKLYKTASFEEKKKLWKLYQVRDLDSIKALINYYENWAVAKK